MNDSITTNHTILTTGRYRGMHLLRQSYCGPLCVLPVFYRCQTPRPHTGLAHLLYNGRGARGQREEEEELHVACFMGFVSFLAGRIEVLRVAPWHAKVVFNAAARANIQTATATSTPLTDAGLNGTGEVIQVGGFSDGALFYACSMPSW